jgi:hypothetical protein
MRKPRDIDAELNALAERSKGLKAKKVVQLGELVVATKADTLDAEVLAGVLLAAAEASDSAMKEDWRRRGAAFFHHSKGRGPAASATGSDADGGAPNPGGAASG